MSTKLQIPAGLQVKTAGDRITVTGPNGTVERKFPTRNLDIKVAGNEVELIPMDATAKYKALEGAFRAHIANMFRGVQEPFVYKLKITYVHFPMTVKIEGKTLTVKNFLGSKRDKIAKLPEGVAVKIDGDIITVSSPDIELAGKTVTLIEQTTRISNRDRRVFLDGIYLIERSGKPVTLT
jgi:large subunit ribosomal protein L6